VPTHWVKTGDNISALDEGNLVPVQWRYMATHPEELNKRDTLPQTLAHTWVFLSALLFP
jgi:hypothetical protein